MLTRCGRNILNCLFALLFAFASLGHAPGLMQAATVDCHGSASAAAPEYEHGHDSADAHADTRAPAPAEQAPHHKAAMSLGCPLANLPAPPSALVVGNRREGSLVSYAVATLPSPPSADLDPLDPPPRCIS